LQPPPDSLHLTIANRAGSVEHYYHFLLGFLLPLVLRLERLRADGDTSQVIVRSCGPMDRHLAELRLEGLRIVAREEHPHLASDRRETIAGFDAIDGNFPGGALREAAGLLRRRLAAPPVPHAPAPGGRPRLVLIDRGIERYFDSPAAERRGSGLQRRSIANFEALRGALAALPVDLVTAVLETATLAEQAALFATADVIVAQHGAALANTIWCRPGTRVIEIGPLNYYRTVFHPLSHIVGAQHRLVAQDGPHGPCDVSGVVAQARALG